MKMILGAMCVRVGGGEGKVQHVFKAFYPRGAGSVAMQSCHELGTVG